ncbi:MAG: CvpA family protein [Puniceicoccales bacterium]|jgi:hypothetical protein|nr:CvpA family protein [Puniceicoccales bacterium]
MPLSAAIAFIQRMPQPDFTTILATVTVHGDKRVLLACATAALIAMIVGTRRGYWRGPIRQLAPTLALLVALPGAWLGGVAFGHWALGNTLVPWLLRGPVGMLLLGCVLWLAALALLWHFGRPRTANALGETDNPVLGAFVGCWTAILWSAAGFLLLATTGAIAQFWLDNTPQTQNSIARPVLTQLVRIKNSLALLNHLAWLRHWNPLPTRISRTIEKGIRILNTPDAFTRLKKIPTIRAIATEATFYPLLQNPEILKLAANHDIEALIAHPLILKLLADEALQQKLADIDFEKLFDDVLAAAPPPPQPATRTTISPPP